MAGTTPRLALPYPVGADTVDVPRDMQALANKLDPTTPAFVQGTAAARPAAGVAGRFHYATDTGALSYDTGSAWLAVAPVPALVSALPGAPIDGQEIYYNNASAGVIWHLRYASGWGGLDGYGWMFLGGSSLAAEVVTTVSAGNTTYAGQGGPGVTAPLAGNYRGFMSLYAQTAAGFGTYASPMFGATTPANDDNAAHVYSSASIAVGAGVARSFAANGLTAGMAVNMVYRVSGGTGAWARRRIELRPIRVG